MHRYSYTERVFFFLTDKELHVLDYSTTANNWKTFSLYRKINGHSVVDIGISVSFRDLYIRSGILERCKILFFKIQIFYYKVSLHTTNVGLEFSLIEWRFSEFGEFKESDQSLEYGLWSIYRSFVQLLELWSLTQQVAGSNDNFQYNISSH